MAQLPAYETVMVPVTVRVCECTGCGKRRPGDPVEICIDTKSGHRRPKITFTAKLQRAPEGWHIVAFQGDGGSSSHYYCADCFPGIRACLAESRD